MLIIKVEREGGLWEYLEFDNFRSAAIYLIKNPELKLRLAAIASSDAKDTIAEVKKKLV